jgi:hypothetical protein
VLIYHLIIIIIIITTTTTTTGSSQQPKTQPDESVSAQLAQQTTKTGKPRKHIKWDDKISTFITRSYYIHTENTTDTSLILGKTPYSEISRKLTVN